MKKLLLLFVSTLLFISCSDESNNNVDVNQNDLVGTWSLTKFDLDATTSGSSQGIDFSSNIKSIGKDYNLTITFTENPKEFTVDGSFTLVSTTNIAGDIDTVEEEVSTISELNSGEWKIENNQLLLIGDNISSGININSFTGNKIILKQPVDFNRTEQGGTIKIKSETTFIFEK